MAWTLREHQQEPDRLGHLLYWQQLLEPAPGALGDVVWQHDNSLLSVLAYRGPDTESADAYELMALNARLHAVVLSLGAGWTLHWQERRHTAPPQAVSTCAHPVALLADEERRAQINAPGAHFETTYHLTLTWQIPRTVGAWWQRLWWEHIPEGHAQTNIVTRFRDEIARVHAHFAGILEEVTLLTGEALMAYLKSTVSEHVQPQVHVPEPPWWLWAQLTDTPFHPGVTPKLGNLWLRPIVVKNERRQTAFPATTYPGILDVLHDLPIEYRYVERWIPLSYAAARKELNALENLFRGQHKSMTTQLMERVSGQVSDKIEQAADRDAAEMSEARALLDQGAVQWGYCTLTVLVWDTDFAVAEQKRELVEEGLRAKGFLASVEQIDAVGAVLGMLPGDSYNNVERPLVTSITAMHLAPVTSVWSGPTWVPHLNGPALITGTARGHAPFRLSTHTGDVGDFFCVAPKGAGKSALAVLMELGWDRYGASRVIVLDKGASHKAATLGMGGAWIDLAPHTTRPLQPFARIEDPEERTWSVDLVEDLLELEGFRREPVLNRELWGAMQSLGTFAPRARTMSGFSGLVQSSQIRDALYRYTVDGAYPILDGETDWLHIRHWTCFEMEKLIDDFPRLVPLVAKVLFRRVETALDGCPTLITVEECHAYFQVEVLATRLFSWLKTFRRRNTILGFLTQNLLDMLRAPIGLEIIQACPTRLYGANPHAIEPEVMKVYAQLGVTPRQCQLIAQLIAKREFYYQGQAGSRRFAIEMGPATLAFAGRSRQEDLARMARVEAERTAPFGVAWLHDEGRADLATLLGEAYDAYEDDE